AVQPGVVEVGRQARSRRAPHPEHRRQHKPYAGRADQEESDEIHERETTAPPGASPPDRATRSRHPIAPPDRTSRSHRWIAPPGRRPTRRRRAAVRPGAARPPPVPATRGLSRLHPPPHVPLALPDPATIPTIR